MTTRLPVLPAVPAWTAGFVYLIAGEPADCPPFFKIGFSGHPYRRLKEVSLLPFPCRLAHEFAVGTKKVETRLHDYLSQFRTRGEWFRLPPDAVALVAGFGPCRTTADLRLPAGRWKGAARG